MKYVALGILVVIALAARLLLAFLQRRRREASPAIASAPRAHKPIPPVRRTYHPGEIWTYHTRDGETASRLTVCKVEPLGDAMAVHVSLSGVSIRLPNGSTTDRVAHLPFDSRALDRCAVKHVARANYLPDFEEGYRQWKSQADLAKAGLFTITVAEALNVMEASFRDPAAASSHPWRVHPGLAGRFHPDHPDDVQVIVHNGGPKLTDQRPEIVWVRVMGVRENVFAGVVLNEPAKLRNVTQGKEIQFLVTPGPKYPVLVTEKYLAERGEWKITPCDRCGFGELLDAPSDLIEKAFPELAAGESVEALTTTCPLCGGVQVIERMS